MAEKEAQDADLVVARAEKISVWVPWYFKRGVLTFLTAPFFLIIIVSLAISIVGAIVQEIGILRVSRAVFGFKGLLIAILFGWTPVILPPAIIYSLIKNIPGLWLRPDTSTRQKFFGTLVVVILLPLVAQIVYSGITFGIGWIADQNPCAAYRVGVIGSIVPTDC
jgi:hypothetical protein